MIVLSTGDELIPPTETPEFGQVRDSNAYMIFSALREVGAQPVLAGIVKDDVDALKETVLSYLIQADAFISSGGVSVGERDVVKAAFFRRGDIDFYRVAMQPGMPQGFGHIEGKPYFGLPGNPVSVFVSFEVFVRPAILKMMGRTQLFRPEVTATLTAGRRAGPKGKLQFARVRLERGRRRLDRDAHRPPRLEPHLDRRRGRTAWRWCPSGPRRLPAGSEVRVMVFRSSED